MASLTWQLFVSFAKVGCVSFGGGPAATLLDIAPVGLGSADSGSSSQSRWR